MTYGNVDLKHPRDAGKYKGGHSTPHSPCCGFDLRCEVIAGPPAYIHIQDEEAMLVAEEARLRFINTVIVYLVWLVVFVSNATKVLLSSFSAPPILLF